MTEPKYKLVYFNARGRAEPIRLVFAMLGIQFEDHRIERQEWPALKPKTPTGRLPYLQVFQSDGSSVSYDESMAIARWLAKSYGLMGADDNEYYRIERIIGQCADVERELRGMFHAPNDEAKTNAVKKFKEDAGPRLLNLLSRSLADSGSKFVAGPKVTLGDLVFLATVDQLTGQFTDLLKAQFPELLKHREDVLHDQPTLEGYIKARPNTPR
ncbi:unnamed protein product [Calicophoron daubneyi]|uniref:Uncharacterized protein n=1 Tax=Calicophoron daubneyi TaxID=300641 RepID=A0AAV2SYT7_CALDB